MQVINCRTHNEAESAIKFFVDGFEISLATDHGHPSVNVYKGESNSPVYCADVSGDEEIIDLLCEVKQLIKSGMFN